MAALFLFSYICCMRWLTWFKHFFSILSIFSGLLGFYLLSQLDWRSVDFTPNMIHATFWILLFPTVLTYRLAIAGKNKLDLLATIAFTASLVLLIAMKIDPSTTTLLWKTALISFLALLTRTTVLQLPHKGLITNLVNLSVLGCFILVVITLQFRLENAQHFSFLKIVFGLTSLLILVHFFLPKKPTL